LRKSRTIAIGALGLAAALALTACSSGSGGGSSSSIGTPNGKGKTITVWSMTGDLSTPTLDAINKEFTKQTGAKVNVQTQQWSGIGTKITTALSTSTPPDVVDLGNTDVASFASSGGLLDLTANKSELEAGQTWLSGLEAPAEVGGKLYAVPSFAGDRVVLYNKTMWAAAGITSAPTTYAQLTADLDKVKAKNSAPDFSAMYFPGQYWYAGMGFVWDAGGAIASGSGSNWKGAFFGSRTARTERLQDLPEHLLRCRVSHPQHRHPQPGHDPRRRPGIRHRREFVGDRHSRGDQEAVRVRSRHLPVPWKIGQEPARLPGRLGLGHRREEQERRTREGLGEDRGQPVHPEHLRVRSRRLDPEQCRGLGCCRDQGCADRCAVLHGRQDLEPNAGGGGLADDRGRQQHHRVLPERRNR